MQTPRFDHRSEKNGISPQGTLNALRGFFCRVVNGGMTAPRIDENNKNAANVFLFEIFMLFLQSDYRHLG